MNIERKTFVFAVAAFVALLLQIALAPNIALFSAVPNIMLAFVLVMSLRQGQEMGFVFPFIFGLLYDLLFGGPVGALAFLLLLSSFFVSRICSVLEVENILVIVMILALSCLLVETLYGGILLAMGLSASPLAAFVYRALPCALYDMLFALLIHLILKRFMVEESRGSALNTVRLR